MPRRRKPATGNGVLDLRRALEEIYKEARKARRRANATN